MNAAEHLKQLPALVINVPESTERWSQFMEKTAHVFGEVWKYPATPIVDQRAEAFEWRDIVMTSKSTRDPQGFYSGVNVFQCQDKTLERPKKQHEYAATYSLYKTVLAATTFGLSQGWDRFLIVEDDAVPRLDVLDALPSPPEDADLLVWGGAISMGAHNHDDRQYASGRQSAYKRISSPRNRYIATTYEMTVAGAQSHIRALLNHAHAVDCAWWYTMASVSSYNVSPTAFVQYGESDRIAANKSGVHQR